MSNGRYTGAPKDNLSTATTGEEQRIQDGANRARLSGVHPTETFTASGKFCLAAEEYSKNTFEAMKNNGVGDVPCSDTTRNFLRQKLDDLKMVPHVFSEHEEDQTKWVSFRKHPAWNEWVQTNFSKVSLAEREEMACAAVLNSLCSAYDLRHPKELAKTVKQIMQQDAISVGCWPCEMSFIILTVVQAISSYLSENMQQAGKDILQIFILLWLLYAVFQSVIFPSKGKTFVKDLGRMFFSSLVAFLFLFNTSYLSTLYSHFLTPILNLGLGISAQINEAIEGSITGNNFSEKIYRDLNIRQNDLCAFSGAESNQNENNLRQLLSDSIFPGLLKTYSGLHLTEKNTLITPQLEAELLCMVQRMYKQFSPYVAIGQSLISFSIVDGYELSNMHFPKLRMWFVGAVLVVLFTIFCFLVAFKIIDIFLRLGFVLILTPLLIATAVFPITRSFTIKGFAFLLNIISEFLGLILAVNFIIVLFETGIVTQTSKLAEIIKAEYSKYYGDNLLTIITADHTLFFFFMLIGLFFLGNAILKSSTNLTNTIFGADVPGTGDSFIGGAAIGMIQRAGQLSKKTWDVSSKFAQKTSPYKAPEKADNKNKDNTPAASKKYFGENTGNKVNQASQGVAAGIDKIGVGAGQALQKTGIGAIIGVPLTIATKTLTTGIRAAGKIASVAVKTPGATASAVKNAPQNLKKLGGKIVSAPKNFYDNVKKGIP